MKLTELASRVPGGYTLIGEDTQIRSLCTDSRRAEKGCLFFCTPGFVSDGHDFAQDAVRLGAEAVVVERELPVSVPQVLVRSVREASGYMAAAFYGYPGDSLKLIGLTGTKGKTTTSYLVKSILEVAGKKTGLIGTVCSMIGGEVIPARLTTPDTVELQRLLARMRDAGMEYVVMEISAHALALSRLAGLKFEVGAFTNFSQDHLDLFATMDDYFAAKMRFFTEGYVRQGVYNADDVKTAEGMKNAECPCLRIGIREKSDVYANNIEIFERGCQFDLSRHKQFRRTVSISLTGIFNVYNCLMAAGIACAAGIGEDSIVEGLERVRNVPGRFELLNTATPYRVILDYAHSPDSLENVLKTVRSTGKGRVVALFGCGGNRDTAKRPIMGEIGGRLADMCILTDDNPRMEDPMEILRAIEEGIKPTGCRYVVIQNRREAIRYALENAREGDTIVLAGKGHETYQDIAGVKYPFDEKAVVADILDEMGL